MSRLYADGRVVGEWERHHPQAHEIAASIPQPMLALSSAMLVSDIREKFGCCEHTARTAISFARQARA